MRKVKWTAIICGFISIVSTIVFYLLAFKDLFAEPDGWVLLALLLAAEVFGIIKVFAAASTAVVKMDEIGHVCDANNKCGADNNYVSPAYVGPTYMGPKEMSPKEIKKFNKLKKKYRKIIIGKGEKKLVKISRAVGRKYEATVQDIQYLIDTQILKNSYIDPNTREIVFIRPRAATIAAQPGMPGIYVNVHQHSNPHLHSSPNFNANPCFNANPYFNANPSFESEPNFNANPIVHSNSNPSMYSSPSSSSYSSPSSSSTAHPSVYSSPMSSSHPSVYSNPVSNATPNVYASPISNAHPNVYASPVSHSSANSYPSANVNADINSSAAVFPVNANSQPQYVPQTVVAVPATSPRVVSCPCCGANNMITGEFGKCEYCRNIIS